MVPPPEPAAESGIMVQSLETRRPNVRLIRPSARSRKRARTTDRKPSAKRTRRHRKH